MNNKEFDGRLFSCRVPLRISFFGGGTDIPEFYEKHEGAVISSTINRYIYVTVKHHSKLFGEKFRLNYSETEKVSKVEEIKNDIARECIKYLKVEEQLLISTYSDLPASSGLGSSSAFCVGLLNALYQLQGNRPTLSRLAEEACEIELNVLGQRIGKQDQYAAAFGGFNVYQFAKNGDVTITPVKTSKTTIKTLFSSILLVWTGMQRQAGKILESIEMKETKVEQSLLSMKKYVFEASVIFKNNADAISEIGTILQENWNLKKSLSNGISGKTIDNIIEVARLNGSYGAKILGAGGGGFVMLLAPEERQEDICRHLSQFQIERIKFEPRGVQELFSNL